MLLDHLTDAASLTAMSSSSSFFTSSPTVVLPPTQPDHYFASSAYANGTTNGQSPNALGSPFTPNGSIPPTPGSLAGRKRSRNDIYAPEEEDEHLGDGSVDTQFSGAQAKQFGQTAYGPGWAQSNNTAFGAAAESQLPDARRPSIQARKSQRVDASDSNPDDLPRFGLPQQTRESPTDPFIDEATRALGISWKRMDASEAGMISQAAYAKWIQNHYDSLKDVGVWFENSAIPGYLVAAKNVYTRQQEFYIFSNDLTEARLVTNDSNLLVRRLQMLPSGLEVAAPGGLIRAETDPITAAQNEVNEVAVIQQGRPAWQTHRPNNVSVSEDFFMDPGMIQSYFCAAHEMDMD